VTDMAILSVSETHRLDALEGVIERGKAAFVEVGEALLEIRDRRLYRESHGTFEAYCSERWGFTHTYAKHLITASRVVSAIGSQTDTTVSVPTPRNESVARELAPVLREAPEKVAETWQHAVDTYGPQPTAAQVRSIVRDEPVHRRAGRVVTALRVVRPEAARHAEMPAGTRLPADAAILADALTSVAAASPSPTATPSQAVGEGRLIPLLALRRVVAEISADVAELDGAIAAGGVDDARLALYRGQVAAYENVLVLLRDTCGVSS